MRPHHLTLTAFGPFAGTVEADLDALAAGGLFLLHGQTGAGKTTLLDALCFALFGRVPGERGVKRLRSDHAAPGAVCTVTAELTVGGRRLRITRSPAQERAKKRGTGTLTEQPTIRVEELRVGSWTTWSTRPGEADAEIADLVGMSAEQFWQVVLLPQGGFATFLHADDRARAELLERLFDTHRFRAVEAWLADRRRETADALAAVGGALVEQVGRIAQVAEIERPATVDQAWYDAALTALDAELTLAGQSVVAATAAADAAAGADRAAERTAELQRRRAAAEAVLASLVDGEPLRRRLAAARRADPLRPLAARAERDRTAADTAACPAPDPSALAAATASLAALEALAPQHDRVAAARAEAARAVAEADLARRALAALDDERAALPAQRAEAVRRESAALAATRRQPAAEAEASRLRALADDVVRAIDLAARLTSATSTLLTARERAVAAREDVAGIRTVLLSGQAARLAADLTDGESCPVCGAREHPAPAVGAGAPPTEAELAVAEAVADRTELVRAQADLQAATLTVQAEEVAGRLDAAGCDDVPTAAAAAAAFRRETADLAADHPAAAGARAAVEARAADLGARAATLGAEVEAADRRRAQTCAVAERETATLTSRLGDAADLDTALVAARIEQAAQTSRAEAHAVATRLAAAAADAEADLAAAVADAAGATVADALAPTDLRQLEQALADHDIAAATAGAVLAEPSVASAPTEPVDTAAAGAEAIRAAAERDAVSRAHAVVAQRRGALADLGPGLAAVLATVLPLQAAAAEAAALADTTGGRNDRRMTLSTYVLAARLEQVAAVASGRLSVMTDGRYTLRHTDVGADGRRRAGLGLEVVDGWTGVHRDTRTLSGGETFVASLALALGLADVVTAEAGGAPFEALFVDEGFGSLDPETLEEVMDVLDGLRTGGRIVGVVSHVEELRRRIPAQLHVRKGRAGSTLEVAAPLGA